jgi:hypothetical protein
MSELEEATYGQEGVEKSLGYVPAVVDMPQEQLSQGDISDTEIERRMGAHEIAQGRDQREVEREARAVDSVVEVRGTDGKPRPENETLSIEEASHLVTGARNQQQNTAEVDERAALAAEIDAARLGVPAEQPVQQPPQQQHVDELLRIPPEQLNEAQRDVMRQHIAQLEAQTDATVADMLQNNPRMLSAVQEHVQQATAQATQQARAQEQAYANAVHQNAQTTLAAWLAMTPEVASCQNWEQAVGALRSLNQTNPNRVQQILNDWQRVQPMIEHSRKVQQVQQQQHEQNLRQFVANHEAQFQQAARQCDDAYHKWSRSQGVS